MEEGLAIAWAVSEHLIGVLGALSFFTTHVSDLDDVRGREVAVSYERRGC